MKVRKIDHGVVMYEFRCPACGIYHHVDETWSFNNNTTKPTFRPSIKFRGGKYIGDKWFPLLCHSYIEEGMIRYLNDCSHPYAGQTLPLPVL